MELEPVGDDEPSLDFEYDRSGRGAPYGGGGSQEEPEHDEDGDDDEPSLGNGPTNSKTPARA